MAPFWRIVTINAVKRRGVASSIQLFHNGVAVELHVGDIYTKEEAHAKY